TTGNNGGLGRYYVEADQITSLAGAATGVGRMVIKESNPALDLSGAKTVYLGAMNSPGRIDTLSAGAGTTLVIDGDVDVGTLNVEGGTVYLNFDETFENVNVGTDGAASLLTASAYANTYDAGAWLTVPAPGNGQLVMTVTGT